MAFKYWHNVNKKTIKDIVLSWPRTANHIKWCVLKSHRWTKLQLNNVGAQFDTVLIVVCFPWINWEAVMVPYSGACTLAWHRDKSTNQLQLIHKHCKLQVKLSFIASFCSTCASALTYMDYFDINYSLTEPNVLCMSRCLCSCVWNRNWRRVYASNPYTSVCLCVCRLMPISPLVNMKNACKADFFSRFFAAIVWRTEAKRTRRQCCQRSQQETLNLKSSEMFLNSGWWDKKRSCACLCHF